MDEIEELHRVAYEAERNARWQMAEAGELPAAKHIADYIGSIFNVEEGQEPIRYDNIWFNQYPMEEVENEWVKGVPDYAIPIHQPAKQLFYKVEIKLKAQEFRKTQYGGTTPKGSVVPRYGCPSFYLDVEPVYRNMTNFCDNSGLPTSKFIIAFVSTENNSYHLITLDQVTKLIKNGWNGHSIATFYEGYGQRAYLIPKNATKTLDRFNKEELLQLSIDTVIRPE